jgi:ABC-type sugar transport system ATPase subunit
VAVLIVSAELDEIYALADRIAVMYEGRITGFRPPTVPADELGLLMAGGSDEDAGSPGPPGPQPTPSAPTAIPGAGAGQ